MSDYGVGADAIDRIASEDLGLEPERPVATSEQAAEPTPPQSGDDDPGTTPDPADSFSNIDPSTLPPELLAQYRNMQADYTRTKQALAEQRREFEGLDVSEARGAMEFIQALNSDQDFALQVHQQLSQALENAGLTRAQASDVAANELGLNDGDWREEGSVPPEVLQRLDRAEKFMQTFEYQQQEQRISAELDRQEAEIRRQYPDWDQSDLDSVYAHAFAHGGDLMKGAESYLADQARIMSRMVNQKPTRPTGLPRQSGTGFAPAEPPKTMRDASGAAAEMLRAALEG